MASQPSDQLAAVMAVQAAETRRPRPSSVDCAAPTAAPVTRPASNLIEQRREAFRAKTGREMSDDNVWLAQRRQEQRALQKIVTALEQPELGTESGRPSAAPASAREPSRSRMAERGNPTTLRQRKHHAAVERAEHALRALVRTVAPGQPADSTSGVVRELAAQLARREATPPRRGRRAQSRARRRPRGLLELRRQGGARPTAHR